MIPKRVLDGRVAELTGLKVKDVARVTQAFLHEAVRALVEDGDVRLDSLGILHVACKRGRRAAQTMLVNAARSDGTRDKVIIDVDRKYYVTFRKSAPLREALWARYGKQKGRREPMEKYGVDENVDGEELEKKAAEGCPKCGAKPTRHGNVLMCPNHGSEPFEQSK